MAKFPTKAFSTAALTAAVVVAGPATSFAAVDSYLVKDSEGTVYTYDKAELEQSYINAQYGGDATLYNHFKENFEGNGFHAFHDDSGQYVAYDAIEEAYLDNTEDFDLNEFTEDEDAPKADVTKVMKVMVEDGEIVTEEVNVNASGDVAVDSVSADNLKEVAIKFEGNVSEVEGIDNTDNYDLEDEDGNDIEIEDVKVDGNMVWLVVDDSEEVDQQTDATLTISEELLDDEEEFDFQFQDTTIPTAEDAEVIGINTVKVTFSEPITSDSDLEDGFELEDEDGSSFSVDEVELQNGGREARVSFFSDFEDGSYTLSTTNELEDYAGYSVTPKSFDLDVDADEDAPELTETRNATQTKVTLVYNEDIAFEDMDDSIVYHSDFADTIDDEDQDNAVEDNDFLENFYHTNSSNTPYKAEVDGNEIKLWFENDHSLPAGTAYVYVSGETVTDLWENVQDETERVTADVEVDEEAPTIDEVEQVSDSATKFEVKFSEELDEDSAEDLDNYTVEDEDGEEVELDDAVLGDDNTVTLEFEDDQDGDFTVKVDGVEDLAGNEVDDSADFTMGNVEDLVIGDFDGAYYEESDDETVISIDFGRKMATEGKYSVTDLSKYEIDGVNLDDVDGANIEAVDNNEGVEITFDTEDYVDENNSEDSLSEINSDENVTVNMGRVEDADGNKSDFTGNFEIINGLADDNKFGADSVEATDNDEITVEFEQDLDEFEREDFMITDADGDEIDGLEISSATKEDDNKVVFELNKDLKDDATYGDAAVYLSTKDSVDTENRYGTEVNLDAVMITDAIAPSLAERENEDEDDVDNVEYIVDSETIVLTFNEDIDAKTVSTTSFDVEDYGVDSVSVVGNEVRLVLDSSDVADEVPEEGVNIEQNAAIKDVEGNKVSDVDTEIYFVNENDTLAPTIADAQWTTAPVAGQDATVAEGSFDFADVENVATKATGEFDYADVSAADATVSVEDTTYTQGVDYTNAAELVNEINADGLGLVASENNGVITLTANNEGDQGNEFTYTVDGGDQEQLTGGSDADTVTVDGQTFTAGEDYADADALVTAINGANLDVTAMNNAGTIELDASEAGEAGNDIAYTVNGGEEKTLDGGADAVETTDGVFELTFSEAVDVDEDSDLGLEFVSDNALGTVESVAVSEDNMEVVVTVNGDDTELTVEETISATSIEDLSGKAVDLDDSSDVVVDIED